MRALKVTTQVLAIPSGVPMRVKHWASKAKSQAFEFQGGLMNSMHSVHAPTVGNASQAVLTRVLMYAEGDGTLTELPPARAGAVLRLKSEMHRLTRDAPLFAPIPAAAYAAMQTTARKRMRMERAGNQLVQKPIEADDAQVKAFVKREAIKREKPCRLIQPRSDRYLLECGRRLKPMEHSLYEAACRVLGYVCVMKGLNGVERAAQLWASWRLFVNPVAVSLDFKKFDQHVRALVLSAEHSVYCEHTYDALTLRRLLSWQLRNKGRVMCADGVVKYQVEGARMSGDPNTSLGNIIICLSGHILYARERGVRTRVLNDGDDSVIIMEKRDVAKYLAGLEAWWLELGFRIGVDAVTDEFERIDFCQCRPVNVAGTWCMIRNPATAIQKDLLNTGCLATPAEREAWFRAVGIGGLSQYTGVPVFDAFYRGLVASGGNSRSQYQWKESLARSQKYRQTGLLGGPIEPSTRVSFYRAFGITPDEQRVLETRCSRHIYSSQNPTQVSTLANYTDIHHATNLLKGR